MFQLFVPCAIGGLFCLLLGGGYGIFMCLAFAIYKVTGGTLRFWDYVKEW